MRSLRQVFPNVKIISVIVESPRSKDGDTPNSHDAPPVSASNYNRIHNSARTCPQKDTRIHTHTYTRIHAYSTRQEVFRSAILLFMHFPLKFYSYRRRLQDFTCQLPLTDLGRFSVSSSICRNFPRARCKSSRLVEEGKREREKNIQTSPRALSRRRKEV